ncbi:DUF2306 domain-containing protein [Caulobacter sp. NIBR2454]|uniref:DUF2306 domain-containing protein n=1 Tax=Caulobacter sp. NIBR2454 TaxID=3015996 RepID=UPI0022B6B66B|nr:DUF2306 domain-containing protein [Caulobacter sp. NIBR2454]
MDQRLQAILLAIHIAAGSVGLVSGLFSMTARKGARIHRLAGQAFFVSMLIMAGSGAILAPFRETGRWTNTIAGIFSFYLVATAWVAARRRPGQVGRFEIAALAGPVAILAAAAWLAATVGGFQIVYIFAALALIAAVGDLNMIRAGGLTPGGRLARHLWRMGVAFTLAILAFFVGQQEYLPKPIQGTVLVGVPAILALGATLFWLIQRTWPRRRRVAAA